MMKSTRTDATNGGKSTRKAQKPTKKKGVGLISRLFGHREIAKRVEEDFPSWEEFSRQKLSEQESRLNEKVEMPPHKVYISSPLNWNFLYILVVLGALSLGYGEPTWGPYFVYGAIFFVFGAALFVLARDSIFLHIEGQRLESDCELINKFASGEQELKEDGGGQLLQNLSTGKSSVFRSWLMQIHYQNILRTFEQGNRRAWVNQDASISDLNTLLTQRGMKMVWTMIEVLPQLGLLGTLLGLGRMFFAFSAEDKLPEVTILAGFGTALGTTILANLFVLVLRPLYMRNDRAVAEILSSLEILMATFILPTQQYVLERTRASSQRATAGESTSGRDFPLVGQSRLVRAMEDLAHTLEVKSQDQPTKGKRPAKNLNVAMDEVKEVLMGVKNLNDGGLGGQEQILTKLTDSVENLSERLDKLFGKEGFEKIATKFDHDLMQLRVLNHDTLLLIEQLSDKVGGGAGQSTPMMSSKPALRNQVFPDQKPLAGASSARQKRTPAKGFRFLMGKGR